MKRLLLLLSVAIPVSITNAQPCTEEVSMLKTKVEANPSSVLYSLGDAMALYPQCLAELMEAAITGANPDPDTLTQIIKLAVSEYPDEAGTIAEAAVLASPENVNVIRRAFIPDPEPIIAQPVDVGPERRSPIEDFLSDIAPTMAPPAIASPVIPEVKKTEPKVEVMTSKPFDPDDVASTALRAIDELLIKLKNQEIEGSGEVAGANSGDLKLPVLPERVEKFRLNIPDQTIAISTINDGAHHDMIDEQLENPTDEPLVIQDAASDEDLANYIREMELNEEVADVKQSKAAAGPVKFTSSIYPIPSFGSDSLVKGKKPSVRSASVSPTLPRARN